MTNGDDVPTPPPVTRYPPVKRSAAPSEEEEARDKRHALERHWFHLQTSELQDRVDRLQQRVNLRTR